jgi:hypothetical protein
LPAGALLRAGMHPLRETVMKNAISVFAVSLALLGFAAVSAPAASAAEAHRIDEKTYQTLHQTLPGAEAQINKSQAESRAMARAVGDGDQEKVRAILMRNGVPADALHGVEIRLDDRRTHQGAMTEALRLIIRIRLVDHVYLIITVE